MVASETLNRDFLLRGPAAEFFQYEGREALLEGGTRCGKGGPLWETVWTPTGARELGELKVGDFVLGGDGGPTKVIQVHELGEQTIYSVEFSTGEVVFTTHDHLWDVFTRPNHKTGKIKRGLMTTAALKERLKKTTRFDAWVPMAVAHFKPQEHDLPMHPYVLGVLLGDGGLTGGHVAFSKDERDGELVRRVASLWPGGVSTCKDKRQHSLPGALPTMRALGLMGKKSIEKSIPKVYMFASVAARLELIRGLMDTDGSVEKQSGMPRFSVSSLHLAQDFLTVIQSLGGAGHITSRKTTHADSHNVSFCYDNCVDLFRLERKRALASNRTKFKTKRLIRRIRALSAPEPARCISVEAADGLYMTSGFIVTHNSYAFLIKAKIVAETFPRSRQLIARQTRKSLNESILRDWREDILWIGHEAVSPSATKEHQDLYRWKNGSEVYFVGLEGMRDTASPILSTQWDRIYVCQAEETDKNDWEVLATRLSSFKTPYHQLTADCNPAAPSHWLNTRFAPDELSDDRARFSFRHYDNPLFYDGVYPEGAWTREGEEYMSILEGTLTGVRRERFLNNKWVAAEGQILENWDPRIHSIHAELELDRHHGWLIHRRDQKNPIRVAYFTCGVDWGWNPDPGCFSLWAYDSPKWHPLIRRFRVAEVMKLRWQREEWADLAEAWYKKYGISWFSCDPSDPENISYFKLRLGKLNRRNTPPIALKCPPIGGGHQRAKNMTAQIDLMREGLMGATGHTRSFFFKDAFPEGIDQELRKAGRPTSYEQEVESWTYDIDTAGNAISKPSPKCDDHAIKAAMYDETLSFVRGFGKRMDAAPGTMESMLEELRRDGSIRDKRGNERRSKWAS